MLLSLSLYPKEKEEERGSDDRKRPDPEFEQGIMMMTMIRRGEERGKKAAKIDYRVHHHMRLRWIDSTPSRPLHPAHSSTGDC